MPGSNEKEYNYTLRGKFKDELTDKSKKTFRSFRQNAVSSMKAFKTAAVAAFAVVATVMAKMSHEVIGLAGKLADLSGRLNLSVEFLSKLEFAAERSGVAFQEVGIAVQRMQRRLVDAEKKGTGPVVDALNKMKLSATELLRAGPEKALSLLADGFKNIESQAVRVSSAFALFDSGGVALLQMLQQGRDGFEGLTRKAKELGLVVSKDTAEAFASFSEVLSDLWKVVRGGVTRGLLPLVKEILNVRTAIEGLGQTFADITTGGFKVFLNFAIIVSNSLNTMAAAALGLSGAMFNVFKAIAAVTDMMGLTEGATVKWRMEADAAIGAAGELIKRIVPLVDLFEDQSKSADKAAETLNKQKEIMEGLNHSTQDTAENTDKATASQEKFTKAVQKTTKAIQQFNSPAAEQFKKFQDNPPGFRAGFTTSPENPSKPKDRVRTEVDRIVQEEKDSEFERQFNNEVQRQLARRKHGAAGSPDFFQSGGSKTGFQAGDRGGSFDSGGGIPSGGSGSGVGQIIRNGGNTIIVQGNINVSSETFPNLAEQALKITREQGRHSRRSNGTVDVNSIAGPSIGNQERFLGRRVIKPKFTL